MKKIKLAILGSTRGSNLLPILEAIKNKSLNAEVITIISNKQEAGILEKAKNFNIDHHAIVPEKGEARTDYDQRLTKILVEKNIDLIVLIGFMRILSPEFIATFKGRIINVHPSLLPKHKGLMDLAVHQAVLDHKENSSGCSVHFVTEEVDGGEVIVQKQCSVDAHDTAATLKAKVQALEGEALIQAINSLLPLRTMVSRSDG